MRQPPPLRSTLIPAVLVAVLAIQPAAARAAEEPAVIRQVAGEVLGGDRFQRWSPAGSEEPPPEPPERGPTIDLPRRGARGVGGGRGGVGAALLPSWLGLGLMGFGLLLALLWIARLLGDARPKTRAPRVVEAAPGAVPEPGPERLPTLEEALRMADAGRLDDAVHLLLLAALGRVLGTTGVGGGDVRTSREIVADLDVREDRSEALRRLVQAVEFSHFARRPLGRPEFDRCVESYRLLATSPSRSRGGVR